jgi:signal transduction histidine kinase
LNNFILQSLKKFDKLTKEQARSLFTLLVGETDLFETALNSLVLGILVCNEDHKLVLKNRAAERILAIDETESAERPPWALVKNVIIADFLFNTLSSGDRVEGRDFLFGMHDSAQRILEFNVLPLVKNHHVTGSLITIEDVTEKKLRETKIRRIENLASLTTLAAGIAHEIKNPLSAISIHVNLLRKILENGKKEYVKKNMSPLVSYDSLEKHIIIVNEEIERLNRTVVDFLFAVRPMDITLIKSDINKLLRDIISLITLELEKSEIKCIVLLEDRLPLAEFDEHHLKQALLNLIKNAMEAMQGGHGGILTIKTESNDTDIIISITDSGCGISEEDKVKIFEPYWTTKNMGTGLGLTLVYKIIRDHNGEIIVNSKEGEGTSFIITLPIPSTGRHLLNYKRGAYEI